MVARSRARMPSMISEFVTNLKRCFRRTKFISSERHEHSCCLAWPCLLTWPTRVSSAPPALCHELKHVDIALIAQGYHAYIPAGLPHNMHPAKPPCTRSHICFALDFLPFPPLVNGLGFQLRTRL